MIDNVMLIFVRFGVLGLLLYRPMNIGVFFFLLLFSFLIIIVEMAILSYSIHRLPVENHYYRKIYFEPKFRSCSRNMYMKIIVVHILMFSIWRKNVQTFL